MQRGTSPRMKLFRISVYAHTEISQTVILLGLLKNGSVHGFETVLLSFPIDFATNFETIF